MSKTIVTFIALFFTLNSFSQVICNVEAPINNSGLLSFGTTINWGANLSDPNNAVLDTVKIATDSLACSAVTNDLTGRIALVYRGGCNYSAKAYNAQNAGAIACILVNNVPGLPLDMGAGVNANNVTIPVIMISITDGELLHDLMENGEDVVVYIGHKNSYYPNDLGFTIKDVLHADASALPIQLAQNGSEFNTTLGGWVRNYGTADQTGITLNAMVNNGATVYNQTSSAFSLLSGDSAFVTLPDFNLSTYPTGSYTLTYTIDFGNTDDYSDDNTLVSEFVLTDSVFALARLDTQMSPIATIGFKPSTFSSYSSCLAFSNAHASRIGALGMYFSASVYTSTANPDSLNGDEVKLKVLQWDDQFSDINDITFGFASLTEIASSTFQYPVGAGSGYNGLTQYMPFDEPITLEDNQRYLFCVQTHDTRINFGHDQKSNYNQNYQQDLQVFHPYESNDNFVGAGFPIGYTPSLAVKVADASVIGLTENSVETSAFPNPSNGLITVKSPVNGLAVLTITDLSGRIVQSETVQILNGTFTIDVDDFNSGTYVFSLDYKNGAKSRFKVVVTK